MGKKIFVSYKYADSNVQRLATTPWNETTTVRSYVDELENYFDRTNDIYKGESNDEDLSQYTEDQIWEKLKDRIYDSSVTIVMISPNMKETHKRDRSQWIPWEISFSLKETTRNDRTSHSNAMFAIVLPDKNGSYDYYLSQSNCGVTVHNTDTLFEILRENKFNIKLPEKKFCFQCHSFHYTGQYSYIEAIRWSDFISFPNYYIETAVKRYEKISDYEITKEV